MNHLRQLGGKLLRTLPWLIDRAARLLARKPSSGSPSPERLGEVRRILVIRLDAIGDFLMTTPALRALRKRFPAAGMDLLVQPGVRPIAETFPGLRRTETLRCGFLIRGGDRLAGVLEWLSRLAALRRRKYDLVVDFTGLFHSAAAARATGAPVRLGFRRPIRAGFATLRNLDAWYSHAVDADESRHIADQMLLLPIFLGGEADPGGWEPVETPLSDAEAESALAAAGVSPADGPLALIHPGGKWPPKRWPAARFAALIDLLQEKGIRAAVTGGPEDEALIDGIRRSCRTAPAFLWPPVPLPALMGALKITDVFVGNDSGPMHMAAASGTPIVALFGPTRPERCGPRGSACAPFYAGLDCSPCPLYFSGDLCRRGHNYCMDDFDPAEVASAAAKLIREGGAPRRLRRAASPSKTAP